MNFLHALVLSAIEGITEFLPVSSTGHLILASKILAIKTDEFSKSFDIIIQLGAILSIVMLYFQYVWKHPKVMKPVLIAFIPTGVIGLILYKFIKTYLLDNPTIVVVSLILGGIGLIVLEKFYTGKKTYFKLENISVQHAILIGLGQSLSIIPGISRAGATIASGMLLGLSRKDSIEFSFLLAVPTMTAATGLDLVKNIHSFTTTDLQLLLVGFIGAWITALVVVKTFLKYVRTKSLIPFGIYRIAAALAFWLLVKS
ncbi:undecaprenyl-diphosphatase UppP [Patescibacteria group bacterium]|nr:undecaprenyl-diphosphatase UppP [Patescibacteria group bacterium]MBU2459821.1 undecaprenyl-diphosphatase UppP [Patescibacteria group bacterium]MBU2544117.1 undecaprenyl-diphosphatase UppP [Patescibacteria group bacterium]